MITSMKSILVTGGAGYIGSVVCKELSDSGFLPITLDNLSTGHKDFVKWGPLIEADIADTARVKRALEEFNIEGVIHMAASAYVGDSMENPTAYYSNNTGGTANLLNACFQRGLNAFVFSSSCATYGKIQTDRLILESDPQAPINPYGLTKLHCEQMLQTLSELSKFKYVALRYFNASGSEPTMTVGETHFPETHLIPLAIRAALDGSELRIYGGDYPTYDGSAVRDYVHVVDLAKAHVKAIQHILQGGESLRLNLGSGIGTSVLEIIKVIESFGFQIKTQMSRRRLGDAAFLVANPSKAWEALNWRASNSNIYDIIKSSIDWALITR